MNYKKISLSLVTILGLTSLNAIEMKPVGFKAVGMGGTGVASSRGSLAGYYNPALLRFSDHTTEISINAGVGVRESNLIDNMDKLSDIDLEATLQNIGDNSYLGKKELNGNISAGTSNDNIDINSIKSAQNILKSIGTNNAFQVSVIPSLATQISDAFAIGVYANIDISLGLKIDSNYLDLIFKDSNHNINSFDGDNNSDYHSYNPINDTYTINTKDEYEASSLEHANDNGINYIAINSMALVEIPISYAKAYNWNSGRYSFGINLKPMSLITLSHQEKLGESSDDAIDDDSDEYETTYKPTIGLDLGFAYRPSNSKLTLGLVGKNINSPTFEVDTSNTGRTKDYKIDPLFRAGVSMPAWNDNIEFALDFDLTKNDTIIENEQSQFVGAGIELHPTSWFALRVGAMQDIASTKFDDGTIATAGIGIGTKWLQLDLSAMVSTNKGEFDGEEIPRYTSVNFSLVSKWGDGYNKKRPNHN
jgi:hypothetical protein